MADNKILIIQSIGIIISISGFNACGVAITKYASAAQRSTIDTCRTLLIWLLSLYPLRSEKFVVPLSFGELAGFVILVGATLVYNEIVIVPCGLLSYNTIKARAERESGGILDGSNY